MHGRGGNRGGRDDHLGSDLDEERVQSPRPRDVVDEEGQRPAFRHESARRRRCTNRTGPRPQGDDGEGSGRPGLGSAPAWRRKVCPDRQGLRERGAKESIPRARPVMARDAQGPVGRKALGGRQALRPEDLEGARKGRAPVQSGERQFGYAKVRYRGIAKNRARWSPCSLRAICTRSGWNWLHDGGVCPKFRDRGGNGSEETGKRPGTGSSVGKNNSGVRFEAVKIFD